MPISSYSFLVISSSDDEETTPKNSPPSSPAKKNKRSCKDSDMSKRDYTKLDSDSDEGPSAQTAIKVSTTFSIEPLLEADF